MEKCEYCERYEDIVGTLLEPNEPILIKTMTNMIGEDQEISVQYWPDELFLYWSNDRKDIVLDKVKINFCPMCGRKLT